VDITRDVFYRGLKLTGAVGGPGGNSPIAGIRLTRARYSDVNTFGYTEKKSLEDGYDASDVFMGMRVVVLTGEVFAATKAALFDQLDLLRLKFTPTDAYNESSAKRGYLPLSFSQPTDLLSYWPSGFIDRVLYARPSTQPEHDIEFGSIGGRESDGFVVPFTARLEAKDPRFYNPEDIEEFISGTSGSGTLQNRGNYPAPLNILLHILSTSSTSGVFTLTGMHTNMEVAIPALAQDRTIRIDSVNKVVTYATATAPEALRMDLIEFNAGTTWPFVSPTPEGDSPEGYDWASTRSLASQSRLFFAEAWA
jgi:hypothetical protein